MPHADLRAECVVVAFHRPASLAVILAEVLDESFGWVVVNVENDPAVTAVAQQTNCKIVTLPDNPGYAAAVNAGVRVCEAEVVVFMNDDLRISREGLLPLVELIEQEAADVAVPAVLDGTGEVERTIQALPSVTRLLLEWCLLPDRPVPLLERILPVHKWRLPRDVATVPAAAATVVAVSHRVIAQHPLPEEYFLYWEESEWFYRLAREGRRVVYVPFARVTHEGGRVDVRPEKAELLARNSVRCIRRTRGRLGAALAWPVVVMWQGRLVTHSLISRLFGRGGAARLLSARAAGLRAAVRAWREIL